MKNLDLKKNKLPDNPGVYFFKKSNDILYIGKATSLRDRVRSYFSKDLINTRGPGILDMVTQASGLEWQKTDSVLEALILEANLIKKFQPKYNTKEKDNKSFNYVCITKDKIKKVLIVRGRNIMKEKYQDIFGPFTNGSQLREAMKIIRRIFPYFDEASLKNNNKEFYRQLGLVPTAEYKSNIKNIKLLFQGKKKSILKNLKKEMITFAKRREFEKAGEIKKQIFALEHINDVALVKDSANDSVFQNRSILRIEAYDVAHLAGKNMVGVMTVVENSEANKDEYRKFNIKTQKGSNDTGALKEILERRFKHLEWKLPEIIVIDGGVAQMNVAKKVSRENKISTKIVSVVKDEKHRPKAIMGDEEIIKKYKKEILLANSEAHRFAITFHKQKRNKNFIK
jgi:excinuclease ABC subunit C